MTHFRCAVFCYDPNRFDDLLAPYSETDESLFVFCKAKRPVEQLKAEYEKYISTHPEDANETFEDYLRNIGYVVEGNVIGYYANPDAKWDWYTLDGGDYMVDMKSGEERDDRGFARKNQFKYVDHGNKIDYKEVYENYQRNAKHHENEYIQQEAEDMLKAFPTYDEYEEYARWIFPYAYITPDGEWHAPGNVGWFASSDDTPASMKEYWEEWKRWIESDDNPYVNFVDCHI